MRTEQLLSTRDVALLLGIARRTICLWAECGEMKAIKAGRQWRFLESDLEQWLDTRSNIPVRRSTSEGESNVSNENASTPDFEALVEEQLDILRRRMDKARGQHDGPMAIPISDNPIVREAVTRLIQEDLVTLAAEHIELSPADVQHIKDFVSKRNALPITGSSNQRFLTFSATRSPATK